MQYKKPEKVIKCLEDLEKFKESDSHKKIVDFIRKINEKIKPNSDSISEPSQTLNKITEFLDLLSIKVDEIPPIKQRMRYGNKAFITWHDNLLTSSEEFLDDLILNVPNETDKNGLKTELKCYLEKSFGSPIRIDYGTGHEFSFFVFLFCLEEIGLFDSNSYSFIITVVFRNYLKLVRKLQTLYLLEPAGSKGSWGLDDFQFLPFVFGSSQLIGKEEKIKPESITNEKTVIKLSNQYIYFAAVKFIMQVKSGPFHRHSTVLYNTSGVKTWEKINEGLLRMFQDQVVEKFPIAQHFYFGSLFSFDPN